MNTFWKRLTRQDEAAFREVVSKYHKMVFGFILGKTGNFTVSEDIEQEVWLSFYEHHHQVSNIRAYLFQVARSKISDHYRVAGKHDLTEVKEDHAIINGYSAMELDNGLVLTALEKELGEPDFSIFTLQREGYNNNEIAEKLNMNKKTVANRSSLIKRRISTFMKRT